MAFLDTLKLCFNNNLIIGNTPTGITDEMLDEKIQKDKPTKEVIERFGLFDSNTSNYNTYYPDVKAEDLTPMDGDFINPTFRALSEVVVHKEYNPVDFGIGNILRKSMSLLDGATVNVDHETSVGNAIGAVSHVSWQNAYKTENGLMIPAGINSQLKIDGKSNPKIARAIQMTPPSIHSTSVTVQFLWDKSHDLSDQDFFSKVGSYDKDHKLIRRIATDVKRYHEISLVSHGADPYAQLIKENKIINPQWGEVTYNSVSGEVKKKQSYFFFDYKTDIINNTIPKETNNDISNIQTNNDISNIQTDKMNKEFLISLAAILGIKLSSVDEPTAADETLARDFISNLITTNEGNTTILAEKQTEIDRLKLIETQYNAEKATFQESVTLKSFKDAETSKLRKKVQADYKILQGETSNASDPMVTLLENASFETISALSIQYTKQLNEKFPLTCKKCGSDEVNRASSVQKQDDDGNINAPKDLRKEIIKKNAKKNKGISLFQED